MSIFTVAFAKAAAERAIKTFAQTGAALLTAAGTGLLDTDWQTAASVAAMAAIISLLTSVGSDLATSGTGPSLTNAEELAPDAPPAHRGAVNLLTVLLILILLGVLLLLLGFGANINVK